MMRDDGKCLGVCDDEVVMLCYDEHIVNLSLHVSYLQVIRSEQSLWFEPGISVTSSTSDSTSYFQPSTSTFNNRSTSIYCNHGSASLTHLLTPRYRRTSTRSVS